MTFVATEQELDEPLYPAYLPTMEGENFPETDAACGPEEFEHHDPALRADPTMPELFGPKTKARPVTPKFGVEISGIQLTELSSAGLDELGLLVAQKGFAVFRNQDWKDAGFKKQLDIGRHFGPLHKHAVQPRPATETEIAVIYQSAADVRRPNYWGNRMSGINWHVDQTHEPNPPGVTFFGVLENQGWCGGDTIMADMVEAYNHMSQPMQRFLETLTAVHSSGFFAERPIHGGKQPRRRALNTSHPMITEHPVTHAKSLFVNGVFVKSIDGLKEEESDALLRFLFDYIAKGQDFHARVKWEEGTVIVWDQRRAQHTATLDTLPGKRRHMIRITPLAGKPTAPRSTNSN